MLTYHDDILQIEKVALPAIAAVTGTPVYVYGRAELRERAQAYVQAAGEGALVSYAVKANGNPALLRILRDEGLGADVTSGGELFLALQAGIDPQRIIYSGVGKRPDEIEMALASDIAALHVESAQELDVICDLAHRLGIVARVSVRVNPDIGAETHPYDSTGRLSHKFGVPRVTAVAMLQRAHKEPWLMPVGVAAHIGSQITEIAPYRDLVQFLIELADELKAQGVPVTSIDAGGGLGINYETSGAPPIADWVTAVTEPIRRAGYRPIMEPGRSIVGPTGLLLSKVLYTKQQGGKSFVIADAGQNDLVRPAMYKAFHPIIPVARPTQSTAPIQADVVGPICETGDFLARDRDLPALQPGDLFAVTQAGAYSFAMSSNYNGRLRLPEVLVDGDQWRLIRRRQSYEHLLDGCD